MKVKILVAIALTLALIFAAACTAASAGTADKTDQGVKEIAVTTSDEFDQNQHLQKEVEIAKGNTLVVTLFSNGTTGFSWDENAQIADTGIIQQLKHQYIGAETNIPGASGAEQWTFEAVNTGTTTVHLEYSRPWEGGEKGVWTFDLTVTVK
jgi:inhibitor of cysteine peptidase